MWLLPAAMIDHAHLHRLQPCGDFLADATKPENTHSLAGQFAQQAEIATGPLAATHILIRLRNAACQRNHQAHRQFRHCVIEDIGRIGDPDIAGLGTGNVDIIIADPEAGGDLEIGQLVHQIRLHPRTGMGADTGAVRRQPARFVLDLVQLVHRVALGQRRLAEGKQLMRLENFDGHGGATPFVGSLAMGSGAAKAAPPKYRPRPKRYAAPMLTGARFSCSSSVNTRDRVRKRRSVPLSRLNMPPRPGMASMISCVCCQYSNRLGDI